MMDEPIFTSELENQYVNLNTTVKVKCSLNQAVKDVEWLRGRNELKPITVINNETKKDHYYEIESMSKDDEGTYVCMYKSAMTCCYLSLNAGELTFTSPLEDKYVNLNTTVKLKCSLNEAVEHVQWFKGRKQLVNNMTVMTGEKKKEHCYEIKNMSEVDVGTYVCRYESAVTCCYLSLNNGNMETPQVELSDAYIKELLRRANKEIRDLKAFTGILEEEKISLEVKISKMQINFDKNKDTNEELESCRLQLSNVQIQIKTLDMEINQLKAESLNYENQLTIRDQAYEKIRNDYEKIVKSQRQTEFESKGILKGIKEAKQGQAIEIKNSVEQEMRCMFEDFGKKMDNRIQSLEAEKLNAEQEKKEAIQNVKMNALKDELDAAKIRAEHQKNEAVTEKENAKKAVETKDNKIKAMDAKLTEFKDGMKSKSTELEQEKKQLEQAELQRSKAVDEREKAQIEVINANAQIREMETRIKELEEKKKDCCIL